MSFGYTIYGKKKQKQKWTLLAKNVFTRSDAQKMTKAWKTKDAYHKHPYKYTKIKKVK